MERLQRRPRRPRQQQILSIGTSVHAALREGRLLLAFQPVVCAATGEVDYFECLLRLHDPERGLVSCGEFITATEQIGLIGLIDHYVLGQVAEELAAHPRIRLGLNVSGLTAGDREWLRALNLLLHRQPDIGRRLVVEITETAALENIEEAIRFVEALRDAGCRVALDDFGAGHTSLRHLQILAVDAIKIDGSFIRNLPRDRASRVFLRHLIGLTTRFGLSAIGECVETAEEAALLRDEGIGYLQGYFFGRPTIERPWLGERVPLLGACG